MSNKYSDSRPLKLPGYTVTPKGIHDDDHNVMLTKSDVKALIDEVNNIQATALAVAETRVSKTMETSIGNSSGKNGPATMLLASLMLACWLPRALSDALPHESLFMRYIPYLYNKPVLEREFIARKYRMALCFTNVRVLAMAVGSIGWLCGARYYSRKEMVYAPEATNETTRDAMAYRDHTEAIAKELIRIYHAHPVYADKEGPVNWETTK
eukprot:PhM_4_TR14557/c0_g2_i1/m.106905